MNILFLSQIVPYPPHGGVLQRGYNILREVAKYNDVHLLAFVHPDILGTEDLVDEARWHLQQFCKSVDFFHLWPKKSPVHKFVAFAAGFAYPKPFSALAHRSSAFKKKIEQIVTEEKIDIIHFDTIGLAPYLSSGLGIPTVLTHHNIESELMARRASREENPLARIYTALQSSRLKAYEKNESPKFGLNIMMSEPDGQLLKSISPQVKTTIVPNGVDTDYFTVRDEIQENAIIYTGGMNMFANKDAVMHLVNDIWPRIRAQVPDAIFNVIGQDPPEELLSIAQLDGSIRVHGYVDDIRPYVAKSAVYVVPLKVGGGTRLKVLDSLAQGKAIVSTSIGCEGIDVTDGLNIHIEDTDEGFADRVIELINDPQRRKALGAEARKLAEQKYAWPSIGVALQDAYDSLVKSQGQG